MRPSDLPCAGWRKSSRSNMGGDGNCVEVAELPGRVVMRDSKDPGGTGLAVTRDEWQAFLSSVRSGELG